MRYKDSNNEKGNLDRRNTVFTGISGVLPDAFFNTLCKSIQKITSFRIFNDRETHVFDGVAALSNNITPAN